MTHTKKHVRKELASGENHPGLPKLPEGSRAAYKCGGMVKSPSKAKKKGK